MVPYISANRYGYVEANGYISCSTGKLPNGRFVRDYVRDPNRSVESYMQETMEWARNWQ